jgi:hypothetical protein
LMGDQYCGRFTSSGSFAILAAIRRASAGLLTRDGRRRIRDTLLL